MKHERIHSIVLVAGCGNPRYQFHQSDCFADYRQIGIYMHTNESAFSTPWHKRVNWGLVILIGVLFAFGALTYRACSNPRPLNPLASDSPTVVPTVQPTVPATPQAQANAQPVEPVATAEQYQVCFKGACIRVPTCTEIGHLPGMTLNDSCADKTPGNQGGYGLGDVTDKIPAVIDLNPPSVDGWWLARMNFLERKNTCVYNAKSTLLAECQPLSGEWLTYLSQRRYVSVAIKKMMEDQ